VSASSDVTEDGLDVRSGISNTLVGNRVDFAKDIVLGDLAGNASSDRTHEMPGTPAID